MKNIFFIIGSLEKGGAEYVFSKLINHYCKKTKCTLVLTSNKNIHYNLDSNINIEFACSKFFFLKIIKLRRLVRRDNPDTMISFLTNVNILCLISTIGINLKKIVCERGDISKYLTLRIISLFTYFLSDVIVYQTYKSKNNHKPFFLINSKKVVIPNFVDKVIISEKSNFNLITCSRFIPSKNILELIDIYKILNKNGFEDKLFIYGEGPEKNNIINYIKKNNLKNYVFVKPWNNNLEFVFSNASIYCSTSMEEGFPNSVLNAISYGLVSLAYNSSYGFKEIMKSSAEDTLIKTGDKFDFTKKILKLTNINFYHNTRTNQTNFVEKNFLKKNVIKFWDNILC